MSATGAFPAHTGKILGFGTRDGAEGVAHAHVAAGRDPLNPVDVFDVQGVSNNGAPFQTTFLGHKGRHYILKRSIDGVSNWTEVTRTATLAFDQNVSLADNNPPSPKWYFQVEVVMP